MDKINLKKELELAINAANRIIKDGLERTKVYRKTIRHFPFNSSESKMARQKLYYATKEIKELSHHIKAYSYFAEVHNITLFDNESEN